LRDKEIEIKLGFKCRQRFQFKLAARTKLIEGLKFAGLCVEQAVFRDAVFGADNVVLFFDLCVLVVHSHSELLECVAKHPCLILGAL